MAEWEGFEPSVPSVGHTRFPGEHLQPLGHHSYCLDSAINGLEPSSLRIELGYLRDAARVTQKEAIPVYH